MRFSDSLVASIDAAARVASRRCMEPLAASVLRGRGVEMGSGVRLHGMPVVQRVQGSRIMIGHSVVLTSWSSFTALGVQHPVILRALAAGAMIDIRDDTGISGAAICAATLVRIGAGTLVGSGVVITDSDFHVVRHDSRRYVPAPTGQAGTGVIIGRNCFIGARTILLKGSGVGDNSVIGAGSVVTSPIPAGTVAAGNPCRVIGSAEHHKSDRNRGIGHATPSRYGR